MTACYRCGRPILRREGAWYDEDDLAYCHDQDETHDGLRHEPAGHLGRPIGEAALAQLGAHALVFLGKCPLPVRGAQGMMTVALALGELHAAARELVGETPAIEVAAISEVETPEERAHRTAPPEGSRYHDAQPEPEPTRRPIAHLSTSSGRIIGPLDVVRPDPQDARGKGGPTGGVGGSSSGSCLCVSDIDGGTDRSGCPLHSSSSSSSTPEGGTAQ